MELSHAWSIVEPLFSRYWEDLGSEIYVVWVGWIDVTAGRLGCQEVGGSARMPGEFVSALEGPTGLIELIWLTLLFSYHTWHRIITCSSCIHERTLSFDNRFLTRCILNSPFVSCRSSGQNWLFVPICLDQYRNSGETGGHIFLIKVYITKGIIVKMMVDETYFLTI